MNLSQTTRRLLGILAILLLTVSCGRGDLPDVPELDTLGFSQSPQAVRGQVISVFEKWQQEPLDAYRNGRLGMHLLVYGKDAAAETLFRRARALAPDEFRWAYYLAFTLHKQGDLDEAAELFREALEIDPGHVEARLQLAELLSQSNQTQESLALYQAITVEFPGRVEGWFGLGKTHARIGDVDAAILALRRARIMGPEYGEIRYALALSLRASGDHDGAALEFEGYERTAVNEIQMADPLMQAVSALHAGDEPHVVTANRLLAQAQFGLQFRNAAKSYRAALAINPANPEAWTGLVSVQARYGDVDAAGDTYREALAAGIAYSRLHLTYGQALVAAKRLDGARVAIGKAIALDPQYAEAFTAMGELELLSGASSAAAEQFRLALAARPNDRAVRLSLAQALNVTGQFDEAARLLERLTTSADLDESLMLKELALAYHGLDRKDVAIDALQRARETASKSVDRTLVNTIDALLDEWQRAGAN